MKKISVKKFNIKAAAGAAAGGAATSFVMDMFGKEMGETIKGGIMAVAGAAISAFVGGSSDLIKGIGSGMTGVGGYLLAKSLMDEEKEETPPVAGLRGLLPGQSTIGNSSLAASKYIRKQSSLNSVGSGISNPLPTGQRNIL